VGEWVSGFWWGGWGIRGMEGWRDEGMKRGVKGREGEAGETTSKG